MAVLKCKMCGANLNVEEGATVAVCEYCDTQQTVPVVNDEKKLTLFSRANRLRAACEFDKAASVYENIVADFPEEAEAYWGLILCKYGIEYVDDPATGKKIPTCHRSSFDSIMDDSDFEQCMENADSVARKVYREEAKYIDGVQKGILEISGREEPYDIFICYKETDDTGSRTVDSVMAQDIYDMLTSNGYRVFFSRVTLEDKLGTAYEPYIFAALNSAKIMLAVGTDYEYYNAVWVKNEWSRFLAMMAKDKKKVLIPCYKGIDAYDIPKEFKHLQSQDMGKVGAMQDLLRGIKKILNKDTVPPVQPAPAVPVVVNAAGANSGALLQRAYIFLEDGDFKSADEYCEKVLDLDPKNGDAYLGKLMAELKVKKREELKNCPQPFDSSSNYQKVMRYGDENLKAEVQGCITYIKERNESNRLAGIYNSAVSAMKSAKREDAYKSAAAKFKTISGYKDADALAELCLEKAEVCRKDEIYNNALNQMNQNTLEGCENAISEFQRILGWRDADEKIRICKTYIYNSAISAMNIAKSEKKYKLAAKLFQFISGFQDADELANQCLEKAEVCRKDEIYNNALYQMKQNTLEGCENAISKFQRIPGWRDADEQINTCQRNIEEMKAKAEADRLEREQQEEQMRIAAEKEKKKYRIIAVTVSSVVVVGLVFIILLVKVIIPEIKYNEAIGLYNDGEYEEAIAAFEALNGYKDSKEQIENCRPNIKYDNAISLMNSEKYNEAIIAFEALDGYKDSAEQIAKCKNEILKSAKVGDYVFFGSYEQDNNTSNGKEDVEWLVLAKEGDNALVISRYALDCQPFNTSYTDVTWETCSLRKWLNETFISTAFSSDKQKMIKSTTVTADKNPSYSTSPGNDTNDKVFLLSITEAKKYFTRNKSRKCAPTDYSIAKGAYTSSLYSKNDRATCSWWLRSPGYVSDLAAYVYSDGSVRNYGDSVYSSSCGVRPAMWIDLGSL